MQYLVIFTLYLLQYILGLSTSSRMHFQYVLQVKLQVHPKTSSHKLNFSLHLHSNPWNCSCGLRPTLEWMQEKNVVPNNIPPTCHQPSRLKSKSWNSLTLDDFACPPAIVKAVQILEQKARQLDYLCSIYRIKKTIMVEFTWSTYGSVSTLRTTHL